MEGGVSGVVLCQVGPWRLAVEAQEVEDISAAAPGTPWAGHCFASGVEPAAEARALRGAGGAVSVDTLEVRPEVETRYRVPPMLTALPRGLLTGFVTVEGLLWPVVSLAALHRALEAAR
jgi:hypothetical protein